MANVSFKVADIQAINDPDDTYDAIISCETVEHVPEPWTAVRGLARVLKPGGRLILTTPNYFNVMGLYRAYLRLRGRVYQESGQPINNLTMIFRTRHWIRTAGLKTVATDGIGHYLPFPGASADSLPIVGPRAIAGTLGLAAFAGRR